MKVQTLNDYLLQRFGGTLKVLTAAVGLLLLIGCANVSILLLARATARQREMAIRISMGASARRILRQLLTESVLLSLTGGLLGVLLAGRWFCSPLPSGDHRHPVRHGARGSTEGGRGGKIRSVLTVAEVALTIILLTGASLSIRSFQALQRVPLGYQPENVLAMNINVPEGRYTTWTARNSLFERMVSELRTIPGVRTAAFTETALLP